MTHIDSSVALAQQTMYNGGGVRGPAVLPPKKLAEACLDSSLCQARASRAEMPDESQIILRRILVCISS